MKINVLGDSITSGGGAGGIEKGYVSILAKLTGFDVKPYGLGGTRIARQTLPSQVIARDNDFQKRALDMDKDADFVLVFGGTNDYGHGDAEIGNFNDKNPYTFYGGLRNLLEYLISIYGKDKIAFITPLRRYDEDNPYGENGGKIKPIAPLKKYVEVIREVSNHYRIYLLDLYAENFIPLPKTDKGDEYTIDGLHPNVIWHAKLAERITEFFKQINIL